MCLLDTLEFHQFFSTIVVVANQIQLLADLNLRKTPQLVELVEDSQVCNTFRVFTSLILLSKVVCTLMFVLDYIETVTFAGSRGAYELISRKDFTEMDEFSS